MLLHTTYKHLMYLHVWKKPVNLHVWNQKELKSEPTRSQPKDS
jgi:hypothetical protein